MVVFSQTRPGDGCVIGHDKILRGQTQKNSPEDKPARRESDNKLAAIVILVAYERSIYIPTSAPGLVPVTANFEAQTKINRGGRDKPGHDLEVPIAST
jgi:hypothetical protein